MSPQFMYGILVVLILLQAAYILHRDMDMVSTKLFIVGLFLYGGGFLLWNFGNYQYCILYQDNKSGLFLQKTISAPWCSQHGPPLPPS